MGLKQVALSALFTLCVAALSGCTTNPYTGRSGINFMPDSVLEQQAQAQYAQLQSNPKIKLAKDPHVVNAVKRVTARIIEVAKRSKYADLARRFKWEVVVIDDPKYVNAAAMAGGKMFVGTGIFKVAQNEAGLAAIMGHEVVHALARHGAERQSSTVAAQVGLAALGAAFRSPSAQALVSRYGEAAATYLVILPYGRAHESEADYVGLLFAAEAGYDPTEAVRVWQRMGQLGGNQPPEFLSSHPSHGTRISQLQSWMPEAMRLYQRSPKARAKALPRVGQ